MKNKMTIIGGGLAGCEAAWQLASRGVEVDLWEMRPEKSTPAHTTGLLGELVCSNSLKSNALTNACGLLKEEMRKLDSLIMRAADASSLQSNGALSVDREKFAEYITDVISSTPNINLINKEYTEEISDNTIIATGPLTSDAFCDRLHEILGSDFLNFFDASAPIIDADSIDMSKCFKGSRYSDGGEDYINCPMTKDEYYTFAEALLTAQSADVHGFEKDMVFEGCMPVEVMAQRGIDTLRFGPLKPTGFEFESGKRPFALVQLRSENSENTMYNMVGFQTHLKFPEQKRVFSMIPGLENAIFMRYGVMHRNTYIDSPRLLDSAYSLKSNQSVYIVGQLSGVEGYVESAASGLAAGLLSASRLILDQPVFLPKDTIIGALASYVSNPGVFDFQPMNANFGIVPKILEKMSKQEKNEKYAQRALDSIENFRRNSHRLFNLDV